ncbi:MAG: YjbQ family protein [Deltaproteobacteria bacterium]|nr:secondary thiamine-phosphate synthase enzyme YjbQ [bacterium]MCB9479317.1 YjbQ family protein [Deltaproteobacteria bacterium]MCB9488761.1 YjbQ family protein [Deltaproteobacteria bacterium]
MVRSHSFELNTAGHDDTIDITPDVKRAVARGGVNDGVVCVFVPGSTAAITTIEAEAGAIADLAECMRRLAPSSIKYKHNERWGDGNGHSHVRAAIMGPGLSIPLSGGEMLLGTWQQIVLIDFDNRPRKRTVHVQIVGE